LDRACGEYARCDETRSRKETQEERAFHHHHSTKSRKELKVRKPPDDYTVMRFSNLPTLMILACGAAFAARLPETFTYVDGNVSGLKPNSGGTLVFASERAIELHTPQSTVVVPYAEISSVELGETKVHAQDPEPLYKVWTLHKRIMGNPE